MPVGAKEILDELAKGDFSSSEIPNIKAKEKVEKLRK